MVTAVSLTDAIWLVQSRDVPANTKYLYNICKTSAQRLRRWSNIVQMLYKCCVYRGAQAKWAQSPQIATFRWSEWSIWNIYITDSLLLSPRVAMYRSLGHLCLPGLGDFILLTAVSSLIIIRQWCLLNVLYFSYSSQCNTNIWLSFSIHQVSFNLCLATATYNLKWVTITHICSKRL